MASQRMELALLSGRLGSKKAKLSVTKSLPPRTEIMEDRNVS